MSYQVIARKWRSQNFDELVGQIHITQTLTNAVKNNRLPHALLFTGPRGTGKTSSARILSKILRCPKVKDQKPCNKCSECLEIASGRALSVIEIDGASNNGVESIRELREAVGYSPSTGKYKIYIIDEVHMLSTSAFNALLKTLEEPPKYVIFILATTEAHKIPHTISSRCQRFDFRRIPTSVICEHLQLICNKEKIKIDKDAIWVIAKQADGSMRDGQSLLDQVINFSDKKITDQTVVDVLGLTDKGLLSSTLKALATKDSQILINNLKKIISSGSDPVIFSREFLEQVRNLLLAKVSGSKLIHIVDLPDNEIEFLKELSQNISEENIHLLFDMTLKGVKDIQSSQDPQLVLEMLLLRMLKAPQIEDIINFSNNTASDDPVEPTVHETPTDQTKASKKTTEDQTINKKWLDFVNKVKTVNSILGAKIENSYLIGQENQNLTVGFPQNMEFIKEEVLNSEFQEKIGNYIKTFWGSKYKITVKFENKLSNQVLTPKNFEKKIKIEAEEEIKKQVESHPLIQSTHDVFKSQVVSIKTQNTKEIS